MGDNGVNRTAGVGCFVGGEVGTGGVVGCFVGAEVGTGNDSEFGNENCIVDGLETGSGIFVGIGVGALDGVWIGEGAGIDKGIEVFGTGGIKSLLGLGDTIIN